MATTYTSTSSEGISLAEFVAFLDGLDPWEVEPSDAVIERFAALVINGTAVVREAIDAQLRSWRDNGHEARIPQSLELWRNEHYVVRSNAWLPADGSVPSSVRALYGYDIAHDHDFSFLTGGVTGPGYATTVYEYDPWNLNWRPGERVGLRLLEDTSLPAGKIMLYRASRDVHFQTPPTDLSLSLNLVALPAVRLWPQLTFDVVDGTILGMLESPGANAAAFCELAAALGDVTTRKLVAQIGEGHDSPIVRRTCLRVMWQTGCEPAWVRDRLADDPSPYVRSFATEIGVR